MNKKLQEKLLEGVRSNFAPYSREELKQVGEKLIAEKRAASSHATMSRIIEDLIAKKNQP